MRLMLLAASEFSWKGQGLGRERVKGKSSGGGSGEGWPELPETAVPVPHAAREQSSSSLSK